MSSFLVTGFAPFGRDTLNPSGIIAEQFGGLSLPVAAEDALKIALEEMQNRGADFLLALGVAGGRPAVCVESVAFNEADYRTPDQAGNSWQGPIENGAPPSLSSPLNVLEIATAIRRSGVPAHVSRGAGRYVCNHFYFRLLQRFPDRCLFLHLPRLPEVEAAVDGAGPTMALEISERAVRAVMKHLRSLS